MVALPRVIHCNSPQSLFLISPLHVLLYATRAMDMTESARPTRGTARVTRGAARSTPRDTAARAENRAPAAAAAAVWYLEKKRV